MSDHESSFVAEFVVPERRARYLELLPRKKGRKKILDRLNHHSDLDARCLRELSFSESRTDSLYNLLKKKGAGATCHVLADSSELDGRDVPLQEALDHLASHQFGMVLLCLPGLLGIYKPEDPSSVYLLENKSAG